MLCHTRYTRPSEAQAAPVGEIQLICCETCGLVYNAAFEPEKIGYELAYDNALHFSPHFRSYAEALAARLCGQYGLEGKRIVEIGCGDGFFLNVLCKRGGNRGWGFDPAASAPGESGDLQLVQGYFHGNALLEPPHLICCRHVLEHLPEPGKLLQEIRASAGPETVVYFEVPDARFTFERNGLWDILYEHCSYYFPDALSSLFERHGFRVLRVQSAYDGQFLQIDAVPEGVGGPGLEPLEEHRGTIAGELGRFSERFEQTVETWRGRLADFSGERARVALWGAGTKGVVFLNALDGAESVSVVVDINPRKHGLFVAGTSIPIVSPESLRENPPQVVLLMNAAYRDEIAGQLATLGLAPRLLAV